MHQALPYKTLHTVPTNFVRPTLLLSSLPISSNTTLEKVEEEMKSIVEKNAVVVIGRRGCCMSHVVRRLLLSLGVNPAMHEFDEHEERYVIEGLEKVGPTGGSAGSGMSFPVVFISGRRFGGLESIMGAHITGQLTPILKEARALWL